MSTHRSYFHLQRKWTPARYFLESIQRAWAVPDADGRRQHQQTPQGPEGVNLIRHPSWTWCWHRAPSAESAASQWPTPAPGRPWRPSCSLGGPSFWPASGSAGPGTWSASRCHPSSGCPFGLFLFYFLLLQDVDPKWTLLQFTTVFSAYICLKGFRVSVLILRSVNYLEFIWC